MVRRARGQGGKVMLNRTNLVQEPDWVQRVEQRAEPVLHLGGNRVRRKQPRTRSLRRVIAFVNAGADTRLLGQLERSIVAALTAMSCSRTRGSRHRWP